MAQFGASPAQMPPSFPPPYGGRPPPPAFGPPGVEPARPSRPLAGAGGARIAPEEVSTAQVMGLAGVEQPSQVSGASASAGGPQVDLGGEDTLGTFGGPDDPGFTYMEGVSNEFHEVEGDISPLGAGISTEWGAMEGDEDFLPMPSGSRRLPRCRCRGRHSKICPPQIEVEAPRRHGRHCRRRGREVESGLRACRL